MATPPPAEPDDIPGDLYSADSSVLRAAIARVADTRTAAAPAVLARLHQLAGSHADPAVRQAASAALLVLRPPAPAQPAPWYRSHQFWAGFVGWWIVNGALWLAFGTGGGGHDYFMNMFILPANVLVLIVTAFVRRQFALGLLAAFAVNFVASLLAGTTINAYCWIPYFIR